MKIINYSAYESTKRDNEKSKRTASNHYVCGIKF